MTGVASVVLCRCSRSGLQGDETMRRNILSQAERDLVRTEGQVNQLWASIEDRMDDLKRIMTTGINGFADQQLITATAHVVYHKIALQRQQRAAMEPPATEQDA